MIEVMVEIQVEGARGGETVIFTWMKIGELVVNKRGSGR